MDSKFDDLKWIEPNSEAIQGVLESYAVAHSSNNENDGKEIKKRIIFIIVLKN